MFDSRRFSPWQTYALLFLLASIALACARWEQIATVNHEMADFAANTILILDAKRLALVHGNYSRVGFYHPGPAILYVLAAGELVFHDLLHMVPSPYSGQLLGGCLYNAAWLVLICALARRMAGALAPALLFTAVVVLVTAAVDYRIIDGMWFPALYYLPYAAMLLAIAPLVNGRADTLKALAVTSGFLINGHVSFVPMLGLILIVVVGANTLAYRHHPDRRIVSAGWMRRHGRALLIALGILFLFLVPLLIATVREFPGPVHDYVTFGRGNKGNPLPDALRFVATYWAFGKMNGIAPAAVWGVLLALLLVKGRRSRQTMQAAQATQLDFMREARALGVAFVGASLALLFYAKVGIDQLGEIYIGLFYYSVPVLAAALLVLCIWQLGNARRKGTAALVLALAALAASSYWLRQVPDYVYLYNNRSVPASYESLRKLPGSGRIVLDLDNRKNWGDLWSNTLGMLAYAKRQGSDLVCINENWHISFSRPMQCRPEEVAANRRSNRHYFVRKADTPDPALGEPAFEAQGMEFYRVGAPPRPLAYIALNEHQDYFRTILGRGWSSFEGGWSWSDGAIAEINLPPDPQRPRGLALDLGSFLPFGWVSLKLQVLVNGKPAGNWLFDTSVYRQRVALDLGPTPGAAQHIELRIATPRSPKEYGVSDDARQVGLSLYGILKKDIP